jgi:hypothetical protein
MLTCAVSPAVFLNPTAFDHCFHTQHGHPSTLTSVDPFIANTTHFPKLLPPHKRSAVVLKLRKPDIEMFTASRTQHPPKKAIRAISKR